MHSAEALPAPAPWTESAWMLRSAAIASTLRPCHRALRSWPQTCCLLARYAADLQALAGSQAAHCFGEPVLTER